MTSPTPYDPPLTYGGWTQSRALGARIASLLRSRETDDLGAPSELGGGNKNSRRHKVIIHTSPFLRCVQTAVAISSGLAQSPGHSYIQPQSSLHSANATGSVSSPSIRPTLATESPSLAPLLEPSPTPSQPGDMSLEPQIKKSILRVDAFLGEWLTPDYFELITPPPGSVMMVAGAKADLLRREDYTNLIHFREATNFGTFQGFPGGWGSPITAPVIDSDDGLLPTISSLPPALSRRDRTSSLSSVGSAGSRHSVKNLVNASNTSHGIYHPPIPSYAISNSEAIPAGFVTHARDACVSVDYQWDSMREPQNCGNGGEYGEEWSSMHKRFRRGLQNLVQWYRDEEERSKLAMNLLTTNGASVRSSCSTPDDNETDLVIILVTHGAGCNALIGALTNQPVLLDVGMASLTMAVRKVSVASTPAVTPTGTPKTHSRRASRPVTIPDEYDVKLLANTEHLHSSSKSSTPSSSRAPSQSGGTTARQQKSINIGSKFIDGSNSMESRSLTTPSKFGSLHRPATITTGPLCRTYTPTTSNSIGLWSAPQTADEEGTEPPDDMFLNFGDDGTSPPILKSHEFAIQDNTRLEEDEVPPLGGLWGIPRPLRETERLREMAPKRRWTVNEPGMV